MRNTIVCAFGLVLLSAPAQSEIVLDCDGPGQDLLADTEGLRDLCDDDEKLDDRIHTSSDGALEVVVCAGEHWNPTTLEVHPGERYRFTVVERDTWKDSSIAATANGWKEDQRSWFVDTFLSWTKRYDRADWYALTVSLGKDDMAAMAEVGGGAGCVAGESGELYLFANDSSWFYWNNKGALKVRIEKLSDDGAKM